MGREGGLPSEKLHALADYPTSAHFTDRERVALEYADRMTLSEADVDDDSFARISSLYSDEEIIELTATIAFENFLSKFHRALRVEAQGFCARLDSGQRVRQ